ncbi:hypothetical protein LTR28_003225 [Elasticomyces elasticus]|nr:hypothetical protein LTR28_003225 [Elasticomyces elasticus]
MRAHVDLHMQDHANKVDLHVQDHANNIDQLKKSLIVRDSSPSTVQSFNELEGLKQELQALRIKTVHDDYTRKLRKQLDDAAADSVRAQIAYVVGLLNDLDAKIAA